MDTAEFIQTQGAVTSEGRCRIYTDTRCCNVRMLLCDLYRQKVPQHQKNTAEYLYTREA